MTLCINSVDNYLNLSFRGLITLVDYSAIIHWLILWFLLGGVSSSSVCLRQAVLYYWGTPN